MWGEGRGGGRANLPLRGRGEEASALEASFKVTKSSESPKSVARSGAARGTDGPQVCSPPPPFDV